MKKIKSYQKFFNLISILNLTCNVYETQFSKNDKIFTKNEAPYRKTLTWQTIKKKTKSSKFYSKAFDRMSFTEHN